MLCDINTIQRYCGKAVGAFSAVTFYLPDDLVAPPAPATPEGIMPEPVLKANRAAIIIPFDMFSASLSSRPDVSGRGGDVWTHEVRGSIRRNRPELVVWMLKLMNRTVHVELRDWYGERIFFPNMRLSTERQHEAALNGKNMVIFTFTKRWTMPGYIMQPGFAELEFVNQNAPEPGNNNMLEVLRLSGSSTPSAAPGAV